MKRPTELVKDEATMHTLLVLTSAFEGIASTHLAHIKNEVLKSNVFFEDLWQVYSKLRVDEIFHFGRGENKKAVDKELYILITAEGGFSGDVDQRLIQFLTESYDQTKNDIIVIGKHGIQLLQQRNIPYVKFYNLPIKDLNLNVGPLVKDIQRYELTSVFYPKYITLSDQKVSRIKLSAFVQELGGSIKVNEDVISEFNYIFEPSIYEVVNHLEESMLYVAISQIILDSKLAQYASRFRSMSAAKLVAIKASSNLYIQYRHSLRSLQDERLKETINSLRKIRPKV
ncbi:MAG TPA: F0F1 ATP synthase subunit gamma [Candidatus Saccharimonadia bacterium]|nr:F0F1 ATP synthase subunit gamma [Candidatus Saccharimonadia bacterium]